MKQIKKIYDFLYEEYGQQGWWPLVNDNTLVFEYHPNDYSYPKMDTERFEISIGAILTQNTAWKNVEKAILNLQRMQALSPKGLLKLSIGKLKEAIKPAGYYNQKARKLSQFTNFFRTITKIPKRDDLLNIWGIGPETADSILLYAFKQPEFIIDTYTKRILFDHGLIDQNAEYDEIKELFEENIDADYKIYQEYHALLVEHAKRFYSKNVNESDPLKNKL